MILNLSIFFYLLIVVTSGLPVERQKRDLWSDFLTYLLDDSDESVDNNRNDDDKYLICRNCEVIVTASEGVDQKPGIVEERKKPCMNTEMKPEDKKPAEALENKENNDDET